MEVAQIYQFVNTATQEAIGDSAVLNEDLSNIVDIGTAIFNANAYDKYVKALVNRIGRTILVDRKYDGIMINVLMDGSEYGSVQQKISGEWPDATENESWELEDGVSYDPNIFYQPKVEVKFFNSKTTFEVPMSFTEIQLKQSFLSASEMGSFISMLFTNVENSLTIKVDALAMRTINNFIGETVYSDYQGAGINTKSGMRAVNLLYLYKQKNTTSNLTADNCLQDLDFLKFASFMIKRYISKMRIASTLFNIGGKTRFTPADRLQAYLLDDFSEASAVYLQSDTYHNELVKLPNFNKLPYFQGSGEGFAFSDVSTVDVKTASGNAVKVTGVLGVLFDKWALGVYNYDRRVTSNYNPRAEFYTNWYKNDASYFNDFNENFVVFFVA